MVGLVLDDAEELAHHPRVRLGGRAQHRGGGALDGRQRRPQLVADHAQELGPQPLLLLHRRQVLHGHHEGLHRPVPGQDGGGVEQDGDAAPVGDPQDDLLGVDRLPGAEGLGQGELLERELPPVGPPEGHQVQQINMALARVPQAVHDAPGLPVEGGGEPGGGVEDHHPHRGGVHQGLQVRPQPLFLPVPVGVGDGQGRLGGEQPQRLLVLRGELCLPFLLRQVDAAHPLAPVHQWEGQEGHPGAHFHGRAHFGQAQGAQVFQQVRHPQGAVKLGQVAEVLGPARAGPQPRRLLRGHARGEEVAGNPGGVVEGDDAVAGGGEGAGRVQDALEHGLHVQVLGDAQAGLAEQRQPLPQFRYFPVPPG